MVCGDESAANVSLVDNLKSGELALERSTSQTDSTISIPSDVALAVVAFASSAPAGLLLWLERPDARRSISLVPSFLVTRSSDWR